MRKRLPIPKFKSISEEAEFWDTHDSENYQWQPAPDVKFSKKLVSVYKKVMPVRLDEGTIEAVKKVARAKGIGLSTTIRMLIRERLIQLKVI